MAGSRLSSLTSTLPPTTHTLHPITPKHLSNPSYPTHPPSSFVCLIWESAPTAQTLPLIWLQSWQNISRPGEPEHSALTNASPVAGVYCLSVVCPVKQLSVFSEKQFNSNAEIPNRAFFVYLGLSHSESETFRLLCTLWNSEILAGKFRGLSPACRLLKHVFWETIFWITAPNLLIYMCRFFHFSFYSLIFFAFFCIYILILHK